MVGKNPMVKQPVPSTTVTVDVIPVAFQFQDTGTVFDPTAPDPTCSPKGTANALTLASPVFNNHAYSPGGTSVGTVGYEDAFQRENFWKFVKPGSTNPTYHVILSKRPLSKVSLSVSPSIGVTSFGNCGSLGLLDINAWDAEAQSLISGNSNVNATQFILFLFYNVVLYTNGNPANCCVLGYHSSFQTAPGAPIFTYGPSDYDTSQSFSGSSDISALSHEAGEWIDDPFGNNATPAWGHIGQVSGCQGNLEVGDPLSGTVISVTMPNGFTYHPQELAFFSWFYRQTPSIGVNGWFSSNGKFRSDQPTICH